MTRATIEVALFVGNGFQITGLLNSKSSEIRRFFSFSIFVLPRTWECRPAAIFCFTGPQVGTEIHRCSSTLACLMHFLALLFPTCSRCLFLKGGVGNEERKSTLYILLERMRTIFPSPHSPSAHPFVSLAGFWLPGCCRGPRAGGRDPLRSSQLSDMTKTDAMYPSGVHAKAFIREPSYLHSPICFCH